MARIFITGSADGLGHLAAKALIAQGHQLVLHARNEQRGKEALQKLPNAETVLTGDLSIPEETKKLAASVNALGRFDVIIHNAGVYQSTSQEIFTVNVLAPYILTCAIHKPKRLIYLGSGMHLHGHVKPGDFKTGIGHLNYSDSKLMVLMLCKSVARHWPDVFSNTVDPGWVPTKMGGRGAPGDLQKGVETQVWLAVSEEDTATLSGGYFYHHKQTRYNPEADDTVAQDQLLTFCQQISGFAFK